MRKKRSHIDQTEEETTKTDTMKTDLMRMRKDMKVMEEEDISVKKVTEDKMKTLETRTITEVTIIMMMMNLTTPIITEVTITMMMKMTTKKRDIMEETIMEKEKIQMKWTSKVHGNLRERKETIKDTIHQLAVS